MAQAPSNVFLIDGENDFEMAGFIASLEARLGSPETANINITSLDGNTLSLDELKRSCYAMPFISKFRLVIVKQPASRLTDNQTREKFKSIVKNTPPTTLLVLSHAGNLTDQRDRKKNKLHWLESWFLKTGDNLAYKHFDLPHGPDMVKWIQNRAREADGQFTPTAAAKLAMLVGDAPRRADQEIHKLLDYVNYSRPVDVDDVDHLSPNSAPAGDFALVNALRAKNTKQAQSVLHKQLEDNDALGLIARITSQFRQLILVRELLDQSATPNEISNRLQMHQYATSLAIDHARHFDMSTLENIYQRFHEIDFAIKSGKIEPDVALDLLVIELTNKPG